MKISKNWFIRFEPNFQTSQKTILYNKTNGDLYELSEVYFDFIDSLKNDSNFREILAKKYAVNQAETAKFEKIISENVIDLGVLTNDTTETI